MRCMPPGLSSTRSPALTAMATSGRIFMTPLSSIVACSSLFSAIGLDAAISRSSLAPALTIGPPGNQITIDVPAHTVSRDGEEVKLTPLEFDLLVALARKPRQVFTREVLLEQVWGYRHAADTRLVNVHVQRLRAKIEKDPEHPEIVVTVRGVGYKAGPG